tara:strand:+ start:599 stop:874 length:276 start_codon:yes stop_codon:yes gene_type:complete
VVIVFRIRVTALIVAEMVVAHQTPTRHTLATVTAGTMEKTAPSNAPVRSLAEVMGVAEMMADVCVMMDIVVLTVIILNAQHPILPQMVIRA